MIKDLDEAIQHCLEVTEMNQSIADNTERDNWMDIAQCEKCAAEHRQLAEWLKELKAYKESTDAHDTNVGSLISRQEAIDVIMSEYPEPHYPSWYAEVLKGLPSTESEPAIPLSWIERQIKWLKSLDNAFSTLTAMQISAMVNKWRGEQDEIN